MSLVTRMAMSRVASKMLSCRLSNLRNTPCCAPYICSHDTRLYMSHVEFKNLRNVAVSNLGVPIRGQMYKLPTEGKLCKTDCCLNE